MNRQMSHFHTNKKRQQGFTLAELLIVVAIIAVLVAIAIPIFTNQRDKAKLAVDQYNVRAAKSAAAVEYMSSGAYGEKIYYYNGSNVQETPDGITGYGKSTSTKYNTQTGATGVPVSDDGTPGYVKATVSADGAVTMAWNTASGTGGAGGTSGTVEEILAGSSKLLWPDKNQSYILDISIGDVITYNGKQYVALAMMNKELNEYYYTTPEGDWKGNFVIPNYNQVYTSEDVNSNGQLKDLNRGDLYRDDSGNIYVIKADTDWYIPPSDNADNWIKINK